MRSHCDKGENAVAADDQDTHGSCTLFRLTDTDFPQWDVDHFPSKAAPTKAVCYLNRFPPLMFRLSAIYSLETLFTTPLFSLNFPMGFRPHTRDG